MKYFHKIAMVSTLMVALLPSGTALAANMTKDQISSQIIGKTLNAKRMGMSITIQYKADGSVSMKSPLFSSGGSWLYNGDGICMDLASGPRKGKTCLTFEQLGDHKYKNSEGINFTTSSE